MNEDKVLKPECNSPIHNAVRSIDAATIRLLRGLDALSLRLEPALRPEPPGEEAKVNPLPSAGELTVKLLAYSYTINRAAVKVEKTVERLEL